MNQTKSLTKITVKILHLFPYLFEPGGIPHQTRCLIAAQAKLGHQVTTISFRGAFQESFKIANPLVSTVGIPSLLKGAQILRCFLQKMRPDIVHFTGTWIPIYQLWSRFVDRTGVPYAVSTHGNLSPHGMKVRFGGKQCNFYHVWRKRLWQHCLDIPFLKNAAVVHAHSRYEEGLLKCSGIRKIFIAPVGIDKEWIARGNYLSRNLHNPITFVHLGRLDIFHKGLDLICEAIQLLVNSVPARQFKFIFVGPTVNESVEELRRFASAFDNTFLEIRGAVSGQEKVKVWEETDYFLNMYRFAGMAIAPCEAVANGIPLIASREGNFGDWTDLGDMGFTVPLDGKKLKDTFSRIMEVPDQEYQRLSGNALRFATEHSWNRAAEETIEGYQRVLE